MGARTVSLVKDPVLDQAMRTLAAEAATRFSTLVASGEEIPFDVAEDSGDSAFFYCYVPLTSRFIGERTSEIRSLPAFAPACTAVSSAGVAAPYLESRGIPVPTAPNSRASLMLTTFITELWEGSAEFSLDRARLDLALAKLDADTRELDQTDVLVVPIAGLQMSVSRIDLPNGVQIMRADGVDAPIEAMRSEGMNRAAWQPQFLALVEPDATVEGPAGAIHRLHELITVMHIFKGGSVGLGPHAFFPTGDGKWRRIATDAAPVRPGFYTLTESEANRLAEFATEIGDRLDDPGLSWPLARFEMGCGRPTVFEAVSDHLLALHSVLDGAGTVDAPLSVRATELIADSASRADVRGRFERVEMLEKSLMRGQEPAGQDANPEALELARWLEEGSRSILRSAVLDELGGDVLSTVDESLIVAGLAAGEGSISEMGSTDEWDAIPAAVEIGEDFWGLDQTSAVEPQHGYMSPRTSEVVVDEAASSAKKGVAAEAPKGDDQITRILEPIPDGEDEIRVTANVGFHQEEEREMANGDWLSEVSRTERPTMEWPAVDYINKPRRSTQSEVDREPIEPRRTRNLFEVPEDADWTVSELNYDRTRRSRAV